MGFLGTSWCFGNKTCKEKEAAKIDQKKATAEYQESISNLLNTMAADKSAPNSVENKDTNWLLIGGIGAGVVLLGIGTYLMIKRNKA